MEEYEESGKRRSKVRGRKVDKMSLEDYIDFFLSHKQLRLTLKFLNQIISMHGFKKINKPKEVITDAVNKLDLVDPSRCTLNNSVSSLEFVALEGVIADLNELNWQECCVTSIQTLNSWKHSVSDPDPKQTQIKDSDQRGVGDGGDGASSSCVVGSEPGQHRGKSVSKRKRLVLGAAGDGGLSSGCVSLGSFGSC